MQVPGGCYCIAPLLQLWLQTLRIQFTLSVELSLLCMGLPCSILHPWWPVVTSTPPILTTHMHQSSSYSSSAIPHLSITISQVCKVHAFIYQTLIFCSARQPLIWRSHFSCCCAYNMVLFTSSHLSIPNIDVLLRCTTFSQPILLPSSPTMRPDSLSSETLELYGINLLRTHFHWRTARHTTPAALLWTCSLH